MKHRTKLALSHRKDRRKDLNGTPAPEAVLPLLVGELLEGQIASQEIIAFIDPMVVAWCYVAISNPLVAAVLERNVSLVTIYQQVRGRNSSQQDRK